jgi:transcriptional/translational regulatory protein YebC/TACO1
MNITSAELAMLPKNTTPVDEKIGPQTLRLLDQIEDLDDVQRVYSNAEFPDAVLMEYAAG